MTDALEFALLIRKAVDRTVRGVTSTDFLVNGESLLRLLIKQDDGHGDFMGCFVYGQSDSNQKAKDRLLSAAPAETEEGRVLLYICPECGDIGCGAYAARIRKQPTTVEWHDFAYEDGYEAGRAIPEVGPFIFDAKDYERVISKAASEA